MPIYELQQGCTHRNDYTFVLTSRSNSVCMWSLRSLFSALKSAYTIAPIPHPKQKHNQNLGDQSPEFVFLIVGSCCCSVDAGCLSFLGLPRRDAMCGGACGAAFRRVCMRCFSLVGLAR